MLSSLLSDLKTFFVLILIGLFLVLIDNTQFLIPPKSIIQQISSPIQYGLYRTSRNITDKFDFIFLAKKAVNENKALSSQLAELLVENANLRKQLVETQGLVEQQNTLNPLDFNLVSARPIGLSRYLLIDKGTEDGLKIGQVVLFKDNYLGKIIAINPKKSQVMLSSDPDSKISAFVISGSSKAKGILTGQFGSEVLLDKILHEEPVLVGDLAYSDGTEGDIPRGLILGQVTDLLINDNEVFKQAKIKPLFDIADIDVVFVVTD